MRIVCWAPDLIDGEYHSNIEMYPAGAIAYPFLSERKDQGLFTEYFCTAPKRQGGESPSEKQPSSLHPGRLQTESLSAAFFHTEPSYAENLSAAVPLPLHRMEHRGHKTSGCSDVLLHTSVCCSGIACVHLRILWNPFFVLFLQDIKIMPTVRL